MLCVLTPPQVALLLQVLRWLYLRREFSRPQSSKRRNFRLALFAVVIGILEDVPQAAVNFYISSVCDEGAMDWVPKLSIATSLGMCVWKLAAPALVHFDMA